MSGFVPEMRIGILTNFHFDQVGGAEEALDRLARHWQESGHDVVMLSAPASRRRRNRDWSPAYRWVRLPRLLSTRFGLSRYVRLLARLHARSPLDVLLASDVYWPGHVGRLVSQATGVPYVLLSHGGDVKVGSRFLARSATRQRMSLAIRDAHGVACISSYVQQRLESLATLGGIVRRLPNGWPDEWSELLVGKRLVPGPYIFAMGRVVEGKGFQTLLEAFARIRSRHPHVSLVIAGEGNYMPQLRNLAVRLGLHPSRMLPEAGDARPLVCFPGFVYGETKLSLLQHATLAVSPSICQEAMSLALFEMLCCGVPVIGSRVGGTPDIVQPGVNGELYSPGDAAELAAVLDRLLSDPTARDRLAQQARLSVEPYRWGRIAEGYVELFREVVESRRQHERAGSFAA